MLIGIKGLVSSMAKRKHSRNIYQRKVVFSIEAVDYEGTIDNISIGGVHVMTDRPIKMEAGDNLTITLVDADINKDVKTARIIWADDSGFGAKFTA